MASGDVGHQEPSSRRPVGRQLRCHLRCYFDRRQPRQIIPTGVLCWQELKQKLSRNGVTLERHELLSSVVAMQMLDRAG
jgi:hypothetical protein